MPPKSAKPPKGHAPLVLICGNEEFEVKEKARQTWETWCKEVAGDQEILDASVSVSSEALKAIGRLREALQTLPFFGGGKIIWFKNCNFLAEDRTSTSQAVTEALGELAEELAAFKWDSIRLLISAGKVDKRRTFYKTIDKTGTVENLSGWSYEDRDWADQAQTWAREQFQSWDKQIGYDALAHLVSAVGPNKRMLAGEIEKLCLYVQDRPEIQLADVEVISVKNKNAQAFALGDALGERQLAKLLRVLDEELWSMKVDSQKTEIGVLYGLISKVRSMLFAKVLLKEGWVKADTDLGGFRGMLAKIPTDRLPAHEKLNPLAVNPYVLFKGVQHASRYTEEELVRAMELLLRCNQSLVSSSLDSGLILQQTLVEIVQPKNPGDGREKGSRPGQLVHK